MPPGAVCTQIIECLNIFVLYIIWTTVPGCVASILSEHNNRMPCFSFYNDFKAFIFFCFSEDVRNSLNVLDQVLSEFDDLDDDNFVDDQFPMNNTPDVVQQYGSPKIDNALSKQSLPNKVSNIFGNKQKKSSKSVNRNECKSVDQIEFDGPTLPRDSTRNVGGKMSQAPPMIDRSKKPKHPPPVLPKKVGGLKLTSLSTPSEENNENINRFYSLRGVTNSSENSGSVKSSGSNMDDDGTVKSTGSKKSHGSLGTNSSGTHDYQEINSDICEAIQKNHERRMEEEKHLLHQQQQLKHQQQHKLFLKHQQQKRVLEENLQNVQKNRGRSLDPKRPNSARDDRNFNRGRSSAPLNRRDRSGGRYTNGPYQRPERRSRSSERLHQDARLSRQQQYFLREQELRDHQIRESIMMTQSFNQDHDSRYLVDLNIHDSRVMMRTNGIHPSLLDPRLGTDPRLIESHLVDPRMLDPRYDHADGIIYPIPDALQFPHLINYPEHHLSNIPPILPPEEFSPGYHMYPYDIPFIPDHGPVLTPEEIHILQSEGRLIDPSLFNSQHFLNYPHHYPLDYPALDYQHHLLQGGYPLPPHEYNRYPSIDGIVPLPAPPESLLIGARGGEFSPPSPEEAKHTIEKIVR